MIKNVTFGTDPEFFVINKRIDTIISAIPLVDGTKEEPLALGHGFYILRDNILLEGNIPPSRDENEFIKNMIELKKKSIEYFVRRFPGSGIHLDLLSADCMELDSMFLTHPEALQFGCSPYLNAWDNEEHRANDMSAYNYRTAGFHIHMGYEVDNNDISKEVLNVIIARIFDLFVTIPSCQHHFSEIRFNNYGGLGQYRNTKYGIECRSLGGFFTDDKYLPWVISQVSKVVKFIQEYPDIKSILSMPKPKVNVDKGKFSVDTSVYEDFDLSYSEQLFTITDLTYAYNN